MHKFTNEELQQIVGCKVVANAADLINDVDDTWTSIFDGLPETNRTIEMRGYCPLSKVWKERFCSMIRDNIFLDDCCFRRNGVTHWRYQED